MADPKYVNLPGIAHDQPDTYESPDLPESDQHMHDSYHQALEEQALNDSACNSENPAIEHPNISVESAFEKFRLARIGGGGGAQGEFPWHRSGEIGPGAEALVEKIIRLKREVAEVIQEFKNDNESGRSNLAAAGAEIQELHELEKQISNLCSGSGARSGATRGHAGGQLLKAKLEAATTAETAAATNGEVVQYEIQVERRNAGSGIGGSGQKVMELESRISRLENVLGKSRDSLVTLGFQNPRNSSVLGALTVLHSKLCLWEPGNIDIIEAKLGGVLQKVNQLIEKKVDVQELERTLKLSSLYDLLESLAPTIEVLPELSQRLETIKDLHNTAAGAVREIQDLRSTQEWMRTSLVQNEQLLKELKGILVAVVGDLGK